MTIGGQTLEYDPATYFVMSVGLPALGKVRPSAQGEPYLAVSLTLDACVLSGLLGDLPDSTGQRDEAAAFAVADVTPALLDAWVRMLRLMRHASTWRSSISGAIMRNHCG